jgi:hypothetical protein
LFSHPLALIKCPKELYFNLQQKADATSIVSSIVNYCTREIRVASQRAEDAPVCLCAKEKIVNNLIVLDKKTARDSLILLNFIIVEVSNLTSALFAYFVGPRFHFISKSIKMIVSPF